MVNKEIKLEVGSKFRQAFSGNSGLEFEILSIDEPNNACKVRCSSQRGSSWEEDWNDLHNVYAALEIGEYKLI